MEENLEFNNNDKDITNIDADNKEVVNEMTEEVENYRQKYNLPSENGSHITPQPEESPAEFKYTSKWLKNNTRLGIWLIIILFLICIRGIWLCANQILDIKDIFLSGSPLLIISYIIPLIGFIGFAFCTLFGFVERQKWAVSIAKCYIVLVLLLNLHPIAIYGLESLPDVYPMILGRTIVWGLLLLFFELSKNVKTVIPKSYRKSSIAGWICAISFAIIPMICGYIYANQQRLLIESQKPVPIALNKDEKGDNKVAFKVPLGFNISSEVYATDINDTIKLFKLDNEDWGSCYISSYYGPEVSLSDFEEIREQWKDPELSNCEEREIDSGKKEKYGVNYIHKTSVFDYNNNEVHWNFTIANKKKENKYAILSFYYLSDSEGYVNYIINSLRFN